jgi:hypothetical protein
VIRLLSIATLIAITAPVLAEGPRVKVTALSGTQFEAKLLAIRPDGKFEFSDGIKPMRQDELTQVSLIQQQATSVQVGKQTIILANGDQLTCYCSLPSLPERPCSFIGVFLLSA